MVVFNFDTAMAENKAIIDRINPMLARNNPQFDLSIERQQDEEENEFCSRLGLTPESAKDYKFANVMSECSATFDIFIAMLFSNILGVYSGYIISVGTPHTYVPSLYLKGGSAYNSYYKSLKLNGMKISDIDKYVPRTVDYDIVATIYNTIDLNMFIDFMNNMCKELIDVLKENKIFDKFANIDEAHARAQVAINNPANEYINIFENKIVLSVFKYEKGGIQINYTYKISLALEHEGVIYLDPILELILTHEEDTILYPFVIPVNNTIYRGVKQHFHYIPQIQELVKLSLKSYINRGLDFNVTKRNKCMKDYYKLNYIFNIWNLKSRDPLTNEISKLYKFFKYITIVTNQCTNLFITKDYSSNFPVTSIISSLHSMLLKIYDNKMLFAEHQQIQEQLKQLDKLMIRKMEKEAEELAKQEAKRIQMAEEDAMSEQARQIQMAEEAVEKARRIEAERIRMAEEDAMSEQVRQIQMAEEAARIEAERISKARESAELGKKLADERKQKAEEKAKQREIEFTKRQLARQQADDAAKPQPVMTPEVNIETLINKNIATIIGGLTKIQSILEQDKMEGIDSIMTKIDELNKENMKSRNKVEQSLITKINDTSRTIESMRQQIDKKRISKVKRVTSSNKSGVCNIM